MYFYYDMNGAVAPSGIVSLDASPIAAKSPKAQRTLAFFSTGAVAPIGIVL